MLTNLLVPPVIKVSLRVLINWQCSPRSHIPDNIKYFSFSCNGIFSVDIGMFACFTKNGGNLNCNLLTVIFLTVFIVPHPKGSCLRMGLPRSYETTSE